MGSKAPRIRPATSPEGLENQLISLGLDLAEKQLREGTASSQVLVHFLKLGSIRGRLEAAKIENENLLLAAKTAALESSKKMEELYKEAIAAFSIYNGSAPDD